MQFVRNGPDIPERLLQAHEEGDVVFFCGAGISYPAGLPGFSKLVSLLFSELGEIPNAVQTTAIAAGRYDTAIGLLEADIAIGREGVRRAIAKILTPDLTAPDAIATHEALLTLGKTRGGPTRVITTNFDRLFEEVIKSKNLGTETFQAPLLPIPKSRWDGLVYLHGLLPPVPTVSHLHRLVVSSGDFGLAYLTERWAARFVGELFRNYTICFVGYSIDDPVLRYMMDALAADRLLGESSPEMFAFGSYSKGKHDTRSNEWRAKNVTPILYRERSHHYYLHKTLRAWADTYRDGVGGKERIVVEYAMARPLGSTQQDDFIGRLLWALGDPRALPAKRFAEFDPVPALDWLEPLSEVRYNHADLGRFGVTPKPNTTAQLKFSLISRPYPYDSRPWMSLVDSEPACGRWDDVMGHLGHWLTRHLDDPALILWLAKRGGQLHDQFASQVERRLEEIDKLEREGNQDELERIRTNAVNAIPRPMLRTLWRLILTGRLRSNIVKGDIYNWLDRFRRDGLTPSLRIELRETLIPRVVLGEQLRWNDEPNEDGGPERLKDLLNWEIALSADHVHTAFADIRNNPAWTEALPSLLADFSSLLRDAVDLMSELGGAESTSDLSYLHQPSISEHPQNEDFHDWTTLIDLTRDAWVATAACAPYQARLAAEQWWQAPYPLFKRLALFAATQDDVVPIRSALDWLLTDGGWWLWSVESEREAMRLLTALAPKLDAADKQQLEQTILAGPPRSMFKDEIEPQRWTEIIERETWLRLAKLVAAGAVLGTAAKNRLDTLSAHNPQWHIADDQSDEFPVWHGGGEDWHKHVTTPRRRQQLINWLKLHPDTEDWQDDDWQQRCRDSFNTPAFVLCTLAKENVWPAGRWREALQAWSDKNFSERSWRYMAPLLIAAPDEALKEISRAVSSWLQSIAKSFDGDDELFLSLCRRILMMDHRDGMIDDDPVMRAINHPIGHVTQALLSWWHRRALQDDQGLPDKLKSIFTELSDVRSESFRHGRVLLGAHVISLYRVDREWATRHLLPLFDWQRSATEARAVWEGFLWSPRLYRPLMEATKEQFLDTANHYGSLGKHDKQYAAILAYAALDPGETFSFSDLANATRALPAEGLQATAQTLVRALEGAGDQRGEYWTNRVLPYLQKIWPKSRDRITPTISESLSRLCIAADEAFPDALEVLKPWLQPLPRPDFTVRRLNEAALCVRFPDSALALLDLVIPDNIAWIPSQLKDCLEAIRGADPKFTQDGRFQRIAVLIQQRGRG